MGRKKVDIKKRFWDKVDKSGECWNWIATRSGNGYGSIKYLGKDCGAHRVSWILASGEIPKGMFVLHRCDNPPCVNPKHLFLGTNADNMRDMQQKGRALGGTNRGEAHGRSVLKEKQVKEIRRIGKNKKYPQYKIAEMFSTSPQNISRILAKLRWKHI